MRKDSVRVNGVDPWITSSTLCVSWSLSCLLGAGNVSIPSREHAQEQRVHWMLWPMYIIAANCIAYSCMLQLQGGVEFGVTHTLLIALSMIMFRCKCYPVCILRQWLGHVEDFSKPSNWCVFHCRPCVRNWCGWNEDWGCWQWNCCPSHHRVTSCQNGSDLLSFPLWRWISRVAVNYMSLTNVT